VRVVVWLEVAEVVGLVETDDVAVEVTLVVGVVRSQSANEPSRKEWMALFSTSAITLHPASALIASSIVQVTSASTSPREYSVSMLLMTACELEQSDSEISVTSPFTVGPHEMVLVPPLHAPSMLLSWAT
jgi:hypothetical protein